MISDITKDSVAFIAYMGSVAVIAYWILKVIDWPRIKEHSKTDE